MGFCFFNNVMVAVMEALHQGMWGKEGGGGGKEGVRFALQHQGQVYYAWGKVGGARGLCKTRVRRGSQGEYFVLG